MITNGIHRRWHGAASIILFFVAVGLANAVLFAVSQAAGWIYLLMIVAGLLGIVYSFCCKCCCKRHCSHVILGFIAQYLPSRKVGRYTMRDIVGLVISFLAIVIFPQFWLWAYPFAGIIFWILAVVIVMEIALKVCPLCKNVLCPFHPQPR